MYAIDVVFDKTKPVQAIHSPNIVLVQPLPKPKKCYNSNVYFIVHYNANPTKAKIPKNEPIIFVQPNVAALPAAPLLAAEYVANVGPHCAFTVLIDDCNKVELSVETLPTFSA